MTERARGVADDSEELLSPELLEVEAPLQPRVSSAPSAAKKPSAPAPTQTASQQDAAKQAALKAARMAALQPIAPPTRPVVAPKAAATTTRPPVTRPVSSPATRPVASQPLTKPPVSQPMTRPGATVAAAEGITPPTRGVDLVAIGDAIKPAAGNNDSVVGESKSSAAGNEKPDIGTTQPMELLPKTALAPPAEPNISNSADADLPKLDLGSTQPLGILAQELANAALPATEADAPGSTAATDVAHAMNPTAATDVTRTPKSTATTDAADADRSLLESLDLPADILPPGPVDAVPYVTSAETVKTPVFEPPSSNLTEFGELALLATGEWQAMQRSDVKTETKPDTAAIGELNGPDTLSLISAPAPKVETAEPTVELAALKDSEHKRAVNGK
jgi:hypothetical protein